MESNEILINSTAPLGIINVTSHKCTKCGGDTEIKFLSNVTHFGFGYSEGREGSYYVCKQCGYEESAGNEIIYG